MTKTSTIKKNEHMPDLADENIAAVEQTVTPAGLPDSPESENQQTSLSEDSPKTDTRKTIEIQISPNGNWHAQYEAVVGLSHRKSHPPLPCQDAAISIARPPPFAISSDGAGSSATSEVGSFYVTRGISRLFQTLDKQMIAPLLNVTETNDEACKKFALLTVKHAQGILKDLADEHRRPIKDFRCTLLITLVGTVHTLWLKIGDGALVYETIKEIDGQRICELKTLGDVGKGEYANTTTFIDEYLTQNDVQMGTMPSEHITALFCMSDGAAEKLVSTDGKRVSTRLSDWAELLRQRKLARSKLSEAFYDKDFQNRHSGDDCSIAIISAEI